VPDKDHKDIVTGDYAHNRFVPELVPDLRETIAKAGYTMVKLKE